MLRNERVAIFAGQIQYIPHLLMSRNVDVGKSVDPIIELIYNDFLRRTETGWRHKIMFLQAIDEGYWKLTVNDVFFGNHNESVHEDLLYKKMY